MDEAHQVLDRLDRITRLERDDAPPAVLLAELRDLLAEAEVWARTEAREEPRADAAVKALERALEGGRGGEREVTRTLVA